MRVSRMFLSLVHVDAGVAEDRPGISSARSGEENGRIQGLLHDIAVVRGHSVIGVLSWPQLNWFATCRSVEVNEAQVVRCCGGAEAAPVWAFHWVRPREGSEE